MPSLVTHLSCPRCGRTYGHLESRNLCACGGPLLVEYDLEAVKRSPSWDSAAERPETMWRYRELLPLEEEGNEVSLGEGFTPLVAAFGLGEQIGLPNLWIKDEGSNPTGTFKARGAAAGMTAARERGISEVVIPTAGNAGAAWAAYGERAGIAVHVAMPADAPRQNQLDCRAYGADLILVEGLISDAAEVVAEGIRENGWFDVGTLHEPYRIEGKKTLGFEIAEQLHWELPDAIVYPAGGGVGLIGMWRAFLQLKELGWVEGDLPRLMITQAAGCAPLVRAFDEGEAESRVWEGADTIAHGLRVPKALGDFLVLQAVRETGGTAVAVTDEEIEAAMPLSATAGRVAAGPEGAAALAAAISLRRRGDLDEDMRVVVVNTGRAPSS